MLDQASNEMNIEILKNHDFFLGEFFLLCHVIGEKIEVTMLNIDETLFTILDINYSDPYQIQRLKSIVF